MLPNDRRRVILARFERGDDIIATTGVTQRNGEVAEPLLIADPANGASLRSAAPGFLVPGEQFGQLYGIEAVPGSEVSLGRPHGELVPRAYQLAIVAAVNPVADQRSQLGRYAPFQFNREVRNAATRIELVGCDDRACRADVDAGATGSAVRLFRPIDRQFHVRVELAQEKPGAGTTIQQVGVLADPAQAGFFRERLFQHRRTVDKDAMPERADLCLNSARQAAQPSPQHLVIVASERVARHVRLARMIEQLPRSVLVFREVVHAHRDHAQRSRNQQLRTTAFSAVAGHVPHLSVKALFEPRNEAIFRLRQVDIADAGLLEAEFAAQGTDALGKILAGRFQVLGCVNQCLYEASRMRVPV